MNFKNSASFQSFASPFLTAFLLTGERTCVESKSKALTQLRRGAGRDGEQKKMLTKAHQSTESSQR
ncbi:hypothetical protein T03_6877 [Trichinella britovi]|uniref:Uncharacterized protein n=2 Tax=Trichinella TaxID=6333 RepID=A0A0V1CME9_TRIBR|nr:hypothetical protein T05_4760 [Trichinella murrelli]KRY50238.1 hypothetical protein T03_6877 [Trichinella britovi]